MAPAVAAGVAIVAARRAVVTGVGSIAAAVVTGDDAKILSPWVMYG